MDDLFEMNVPTPTRREQEAFLNKMERLECVQAASRRNTDALKSVRGTMLNQLIRQP
jgi:hypothetical protein